MKRAVENQENLTINQATVEEILVNGNQIFGVKTDSNEAIQAKALILVPGTFLNGLIHIGLTHFSAGRMGDPPSIGLSESLKRLGFRMGRLKTGTTPRLDHNTIDFSLLTPQYGDEPPTPFPSKQKRSKPSRSLATSLTPIPTLMKLLRTALTDPLSIAE
jgi:tRNA uridine 5-carboxymethylaminomethyl modification enzyme